MNISVIVPVLNEEKSIAATLQALAPLQPYETIVVDGGSQDRTRDDRRPSSASKSSQRSAAARAR